MFSEALGRHLKFCLISCKYPREMVFSSFNFFIQQSFLQLGLVFILLMRLGELQIYTSNQGRWNFKIQQGEEPDLNGHYHHNSISRWKNWFLWAIAKARTGVNQRWLWFNLAFLMWYIYINLDLNPLRLIKSNQRTLPKNYHYAGVLYNNKSV